MQILDIILILLRKSKGSLIGSIAQATGRLIVALYFLEPETQRSAIMHMLIMWAIADCTRYAYHLVKN